MTILPQAQQRLWVELRQAKELGLVLYGGTAIALRLGHRASIDFDFFSDLPLNRAALQKKIACTVDIAHRSTEAIGLRC
jgi:hypothetical protein